MAKDDKKNLSAAVDISGTIYHMIVIYGTQVWNDNICRHFFIFSKFWFFGLLGGSKGTKWPKMTKSFVLSTLSFREHTSMILIYDAHGVKG